MTFYVCSFCARSNEEKCLFIYERVNYISISPIVFDDSPLPVSSSIFDNAVLLLFHFSIYNACTGCGIGGRGGICAFEKYGEIECVMIIYNTITSTYLIKILCVLLRTFRRSSKWKNFIFVQHWLQQRLLLLRTTFNHLT